MRNKARIKEILKIIEYIWNKHPDLRLGQLLVNYGFNQSNEIFYIEDDELKENLQCFEMMLFAEDEQIIKSIDKNQEEKQ